MADDEVQALVMDMGSHMCRVGFAGDDAPRGVFPSLVGRTRFPCTMVGLGSTSVFVGDEARDKEAMLSLEYPIRNGIIQDWDAAEKLFHASFYTELRVAPEDHPLLITEPVSQPLAHRERLLQLTMETFNAPATYLACAPMLDVYASGRNTAMMLAIGDGVVQTFPIANGRTFPPAVQRMNLAGDVLTDYMHRLLQNRGVHLNTTSDREAVRRLKESACYVALDYEKELNTTACSSALEKSYTLPDGSRVTLDAERYTCAEALFRPDMVGLRCVGISQLVFDAIMATPLDIRKDFYGNVVLSGGTTMFPGLEERLRAELIELAPCTMRIKTIAPPERKYSTWIGGSILASLSTFQQMWISKEEYDESGPSIVHRKCARY